MNDIKALSILSLSSLYGINKFKYTKDRKVKNRYTLLLCVWIFLFIMLAGYTCGLVFTLNYLALANIVPAYLVFIASILIFVFGVFKSGAMMFSKYGYDVISSMPVRTRAVVIGRYLAMYIEGLIPALIVILPGFVCLGILQNYGVKFYILSFIGSLFIPLIPSVVSLLFGTIVTAISSRVKKKSMVQTILSVMFVLSVLSLSFGMTKFEGGFSEEMLKSLANTVMETIGKIYMPAVWLGKAMLEFDLGILSLYIGISMASVILMLTVITLNFHRIMRALFSFSAKHNYKLGELQSRGVLKALYFREAKRYFSSSIYVTNTIIGPILASVASIALCIVGVETIASTIPIENIESFVPFVISAIFCMMTTTAVSISMEGKQFTLIKSLPIDTKTLFDSKILLNLSLMFPFYIISEICMIISLKPSLIELIWTILIPALMILFSTVFGITVNLKLHSFDWESDIVVVKQSASAAIGGFAGPILSFVLLGVMIFIPSEFCDILCALISILLFALTAFLYNKNNKTRLETL